MRSPNRLISDSHLRAKRDSLRRVPGGYYKPPAKGTNFVLLDPDVAEVFRDPQSVNQVLRSLITVMGRPEQIALKSAKHR